MVICHVPNYTGYKYPELLHCSLHSVVYIWHWRFGPFVVRILLNNLQTLQLANDTFVTFISVGGLGFGSFLFNSLGKILLWCLYLGTNTELWVSWYIKIMKSQKSDWDSRKSIHIGLNVCSWISGTTMTHQKTALSETLKVIHSTCAETFLFAAVSRLALRSTQLLNQWVPEALSLHTNWLRHEADNSCPSGTESKNECSHTTSLPWRGI